MDNTKITGLDLRFSFVGISSKPSVEESLSMMYLWLLHHVEDNRINARDNKEYWPNSSHNHQLDTSQGVILPNICEKYNWYASLPLSTSVYLSTLYTRSLRAILYHWKLWYRRDITVHYFSVGTSYTITVVNLFSVARKIMSIREPISNTVWACMVWASCTKENGISQVTTPFWRCWWDPCFTRKTKPVDQSGIQHHAFTGVSRSVQPGELSLCPPPLYGAGREAEGHLHVM